MTIRSLKLKSFDLRSSIFKPEPQPLHSVQSSRFLALSTVLAIALVFLPPCARAYPAAQQMADAANNFIAALDQNQKTKATYEFSNDERFAWHFIPKPRN